MTDEDVIRLVGLAEVGHHGVLADERDEGQPFTADLTLYLDTSEAARSDDLAHTINYAELAAAVTAVIAGPPVNLIETLAARIADVALSFGVARVDVVLHKPEAPVGVPFTDVEVRITRTSPTGAFTGTAGPGLTPEELAAGGTGRADDAVDADMAADGDMAGQAPEAPIVPAVVVPAAVPPVPPVPSGPPVPSVPPAAAAPSGPLGTSIAEAPRYAHSEGVPSTAEPTASDVLRTPPSRPAEVVLGLGGNIGDVRETLHAAVQALDEVEEITILTVSPLARTAAVTTPDGVGQPDYLNAVVIATTTLAPLALLELAHTIETQFGRVRQGKWSERTLDIDLITYDGVSSDDPELQLPHPLAKERAFVLVPWMHADPEAFLPGVGGGAVADLAEAAPDRDGVRWLALDWLDSSATGALNEAPTRQSSAPAAAAAPAADAVPADESGLPEASEPFEAPAASESFAAPAAMESSESPESPGSSESPESPGSSESPESPESPGSLGSPESVPEAAPAPVEAQPEAARESAAPPAVSVFEPPVSFAPAAAPAVPDVPPAPPSRRELREGAQAPAPAPAEPPASVEPSVSAPAGPAAEPPAEPAAAEPRESIPWLPEAGEPAERPAPAPRWAPVRRDDEAE